MISSTLRKAGPFAGNGSTTVFPFTFKVFKPEDVSVIATAADGTETTLTSGYTIALNANQDVVPGGTVTMTAAPATGTKLTIASALSPLQPMQLTNGGGFFPRVLNDSADRLTILLQQLYERVGRTLAAPISSDEPVNALMLPSASARAGKILVFDALGRLITGSSTAGPGDGGLRTDLGGTGGASLVGTGLTGGLGSLAGFIANLLSSAGAATIGFLQAIGGAVRTVQDKLRDSVSVTDFYLAADGTDDTPSFNRALATGKRVFVPAAKGHGPNGDYIVDSVTLVTGAYLYGEGAKTVIRPKALVGGSGSVDACFYYRAPDAATQITDIVIRDMQFYGRVEDAAFWEFNHLVHVGGVRRMLVENVLFRGFQGDGLVIAAGRVGATERHNYDVTVRNCIFDGVNRDNRNGISVIDVNRMLITGCRFFNCSRNTMPGPIDFEPDNFAFYVMKDVMVVDCTFDNCGGNVAVVGVFCGSNVPTPVGFTVRGCTVTNYVGIGAMFAYNNSRRMDGDAAVNCRIHITGNKCFGNGVNGRAVELLAARGAIVDNNFFEAMGGGANIGYTLSIYPYAYSRDIIFRDNFFHRCSILAGGIGLFVSCVDDFTFEGNTFFDCGDGTTASACIYFSDNNTGARHILRNNKVVMAGGRTVLAVLGSAYNWTTLGENIQTGNSFGTYVNQFKAYRSDTDYPYTPVVEGSGTAGVGTYTRQQGSFRRVGKRVFFEVQIDFTAHTGNGLMKIGLPPIAPIYVNDADIIPVITQVGGAGMAYTAGEIPIGLIHTYATTAQSAGSVRMWKMAANGTLGQMTVPASATCSIRLKGDYACA